MPALVWVRVLVFWGGWSAQITLTKGSEVPPSSLPSMPYTWMILMNTWYGFCSFIQIIIWQTQTRLSQISPLNCSLKNQCATHSQKTFSLTPTSHSTPLYLPGRTLSMLTEIRSRHSLFPLLSSTSLNSNLFSKARNSVTFGECLTSPSSIREAGPLFSPSKSQMHKFCFDL